MYMKKIISLFITVIALNASAAVRQNPYTGLWEGNICANQYGWTWANWAPIGSLCIIQLPNGQLTQGLIVNG